MFNRDTEVLFPARVIPVLVELQGAPWQGLLDRVHQASATDPETIAFTLMMVRLSSCNTCQADSFRGMRGCTECALQTVHRFKGSGQELEQLFQHALQEVRGFIAASPLT